MVQEQIQTINNNFDEKFENLIKTTDETALALAEKNKKDIDNIKSNVFWNSHVINWPTKIKC